MAYGHRPHSKSSSGATLTDAEAISLMKSQVAYTGKYDVDPAQTPDGIKITIHVDAASNQALTGTNRVFYARVDGNKMSLNRLFQKCNPGDCRLKFVSVILDAARSRSKGARCEASFFPGWASALRPIVLLIALPPR